MTTRRRAVVAAVPLSVPTSMAVVFSGLQRRMSATQAYNVGFVVYWAGWCFAFPVLLLGPRRAGRQLRDGSRPGAVEGVLLAVPVIGGITRALLPHRHRVTPTVAVVMVGTAAVNAVGEELLWRGVFREEYDDVVRGCLAPLIGFSLWHLAPGTTDRPTLGEGAQRSGLAWVPTSHHHYRVLRQQGPWWR